MGSRIPDCRPDSEMLVSHSGSCGPEDPFWKHPVGTPFTTRPFALGAAFFEGPARS